MTYKKNAQTASSQVISFFFFKDFIYLFAVDTEREGEGETQAEGEAGSMPGARCGTRSWVSRIRPWDEGGAKPLSHPGCPQLMILKGNSRYGK